MKNILLLLLLFTGIVNGQIVNIPDANFKNALVNTNCVDLGSDSVGDIDADNNNDGEIDFTEAAGVINLILTNSNISDLTGIAAFINLQRLECAQNQITSIDLSSFSSLISLEISSNPITSINTAGLTQLGYLGCSMTPVTSLDFTTNVNFYGLNADYCTELLSVNASGTQGLSANFFGTTNIQNLNLHGCTGTDGGALGYYMQSMWNLTSLDIAGVQGITTLIFDGTFLDITGCTSIQQLSVYGPGVNSIDISSFVNLTELTLKNGNLTSLDLTPLSNLTYIDCSNNQLTNLVLPTQNNLIDVWCTDNQITSINLLGVPMLQNLFCENNLLSTIDNSGLSNLVILDVDSNPISSLNVSNNPQLSNLYCSNTQISTLDTTLNSNLQSIRCGSPELTNLNIKNGQNESLFLTNSPNLFFICADDNQENIVQAIADTNAGLGCVVNSYCSFVPGGNYNKIVGNFVFDFDNNGCDSNDDIFPFNVRLNISEDTIIGGTFSNQDGGYTFYTEVGDFNLVPNLEHAAYFNITPVNPTISFPLLNSSVETQNFCITPNGFHPDLEVIITPIGAARPGFDTNYKIVYKNKGNQLLDGIVNLIFDDVRTDFVSSVPAVDNQLTGSLTWNFSNLYPFETRTIDLVLNLNTPLENPPLNSGDILHFTANTSSSIGEGTVLDNTFELNQTVVNAYDPNDKTCLEGNTITPEDIGKYVHYNINFENIGTADAINVVIKDIIDTTMFDTNSLQLLYASHPVETKIDGNKVEFIFKNINLPPSIIDPIGGHGNVLFKIKTLPTLLVGDQIANIANIYFDYNAPIETNEARSTFAALNNSNFVKDHSITVAPNPAKNNVTVIAKNNIKSIQLFDVHGRILQTILDNKNTITIDISNKSNGIYFLKVTTEIGSSVEKLVKEN